MDKQALADLIEELKVRAKSYRGIARKAGLSPSYITDMKDGTVKSLPYEKARALADAYPDMAERLFEIAGLERVGSNRPANVPPGAIFPSDDTSPIPGGPALNASRFANGGDEGGAETVDVHALLRQWGADYLLEVDGDCLAPQIPRGSLVGVRIVNVARTGDVVVAKVLDEDGNESAEEYSLKVYRDDGPEGPGYYTGAGSFVRSKGAARIVGKVVSFIAKGSPSFK